jgi:hypothetical protein
MLQQGHLPFGVCMSLHRVELKWARQSAAFEYETYSRDHTWTFENGVTIEASATPHFLGNASRVDPEESFVASLSSCHMLTFLAIAARKPACAPRPPCSDRPSCGRRTTRSSCPPISLLSCLSLAAADQTQ